MNKSITILSSLPLLALPCNAAISISVQTGEMLTSAATPTVVSDSSLWAIIYDANGDSILPGGLAVNSSLSLTVGNEEQILSDFANKSIVTDATIGSDKILWAGPVNGDESFGPENSSGVPGIGGYELSNFTFASLGVAANGKWAVYWFPGLTLAGNTLSSTNFEIGGIQEMNAGSGGDIGMAFPTSDTTGLGYVAAFINDWNDGGAIPENRLKAVAVVPEPATLTLSALGLGALLRRRRK